MCMSIFERIKANTYIGNLEIIEFLQSLGILKNKIKCECCIKYMPLVGIHTLTDKYGFQCSSCNKRISIRIGSAFYKSKLSLYEILRILEGFVSDINAIKLSDNLSISRKCIGKWYHTFRCLIATYLESNFKQLGGTDTIVEIDESVIGRKKYNVGRHRNQQWLFGCIERQTSRILY